MCFLLLKINLKLAKVFVNMKKIKGWIRLDRKSFWNSNWCNNSKVMHLFLYLLISASIDDDEWCGIPLKRGQLATSRRQIAIKTGMSEDTVRSCLLKLLDLKEITMSVVGIHTVITICDYEKYAGSEDKKQSGAKKLDNS